SGGTILVLAARLEADAAGHVAARARLAGAALVVARRLAGTVLTHAIRRTRDGGARPATDAQPARLTVRAHDAVAATDARAALANLSGVAGLADAVLVLAETVALVAG